MFITKRCLNVVISVTDNYLYSFCSNYKACYLQNSFDLNYHSYFLKTMVCRAENMKKK